VTPPPIARRFIAGHGGSLEHMEEFIEIAAQNGGYDGSLCGNDETGWKPVQTNSPRALYLKMVELPKIIIETGKMVEWLKQEPDRRAFLRPELLDDAAAPVADAKEGAGGKKRQTVTQAKAAEYCEVSEGTIRETLI
jgi:hypothetical protein